MVSVGMLKEGWDVKNVYVIASLRASVSDILPVLRDFASRDSA
jgi:type III restriction enzyme